MRKERQKLMEKIKRKKRKKYKYKKSSRSRKTFNTYHPNVSLFSIYKQKKPSKKAHYIRH